MSAEQLLLLRTVVDAINRGADIYGAVNQLISPAPWRHDMSAAIRILQLPQVAFRHGEPADVVVARVLDLLKEAAESDSTS